MAHTSPAWGNPSPVLSGGTSSRAVVGNLPRSNLRLRPAGRCRSAGPAPRHDRETASHPRPASRYRRAWTLRRGRPPAPASPRRNSGCCCCASCSASRLIRCTCRIVAARRWRRARAWRSSKASRSLRPIPPRSAKQGARIRPAGHVKGRGLLQQHRMAGERLAVGSAERHGISFNVGPFTGDRRTPPELARGHRRRCSPSGRDASRRRCAGHPARCGPGRCRWPRPGPRPSRPVFRRRIGFCPPRTFSRLSCHMPSAM